MQKHGKYKRRSCILGMNSWGTLVIISGRAHATFSSRSQSTVASGTSGGSGWECSDCEPAASVAVTAAIGGHYLRQTSLFNMSCAPEASRASSVLLGQSNSSLHLTRHLPCTLSPCTGPGVPRNGPGTDSSWGRAAIGNSRSCCELVDCQVCCAGSERLGSSSREVQWEKVHCIA